MKVRLDVSLTKFTVKAVRLLRSAMATCAARESALPRTLAKASNGTAKRRTGLTKKHHRVSLFRPTILAIFMPRGLAFRKMPKPLHTGLKKPLNLAPWQHFTILVCAI